MTFSREKLLQELQLKTLFMAWQARDGSRAWFPIGKLDFDSEHSEFRFEYTGGALSAQERGFTPLVAFPKLDERYHSPELFPLFRNRLLSKNRPDFAEYIQTLALSKQDSLDPLEVLAVSGGERVTDSLEMFPRIALKADRTFVTRFFVHGSRHLAQASLDRIATLKGGESLQISVEICNPATGLAIQLQTDDYVMLGWSPRYLVEDLVKGIGANQCEMKAVLLQANGSSAPIEKKLLVELRGCFPESIEPMNSLAYQPFALANQLLPTAH